MAEVARRIDRAAPRTGGSASALVVDLRDPDAAAAAGDRIVAEHGAPAVVVSNAGHSIHRYVTDYTDRFHDVARTAGVNYLGPVALLLRLLPPMAAARDGHVIAMSTTSVSLPFPGWSAYGASKTAFDAWLAAAAPGGALVVAMPSRFSSGAAAASHASNAVLDAPYADQPGNGSDTLVVDMALTCPSRAAAIGGSSRSSSATGPR